MADSDVPEEVQALLDERLESFEQLECLLLLCRGFAASWSPARVAAELRLEDAMVEKALQSLCEQGLLSVDLSPKEHAYRYRPCTLELSRAVERLAECYADQRVEIMRLMTANAIRRLRAGALAVFSNAFLLRKPRKPNG